MGRSIVKTSEEGGAPHPIKTLFSSGQLIAVLLAWFLTSKLGARLSTGNMATDYFITTLLTTSIVAILSYLLRLVADFVGGAEEEEKSRQDRPDFLTLRAQQSVYNA
jgi:hypothetical protein